ncbi:hypothetical protein LZ554_007092 [Drepanopeziza brunnea f. sp. 'monogermtubi']|nr:hypothetical protein LZ554_007092 [Drepanopeziza brunnea f. sp. 'monogermtubi']
MSSSSSPNPNPNPNLNINPNPNGEMDEQLLHGIERLSFPQPTDFSNMEAYHTARLEEQWQYSLKVQERAQLVLQTAVDDRQAKLLKAKADALEKSVAAAEKKAREEIRIREAENRAKQIPHPPPRLPTPPPPPAPPVVQPTPPVLAEPVKGKDVAQPSQPSPTSPAGPANPSSTPEHPPKLHNPFVKGPAAHPVPPSPNPFRAAPPGAKPGFSQPPSQPPSGERQNPFEAAPAAPAPPVRSPVANPQPPPPARGEEASVQLVLANVQRYDQILQDCKKLRKYVLSLDQNSMSLPNVASPAAGNRNYSVKSLAGDLRRMLNRTLGQLTDGAGTNKDQALAIRNIFDLTLSPQAPSPLINPEQFLVTPPAKPVADANSNNGQLPCLFIYVVNIFAKAIVKQLASEAAVNPRIAEPVGVLVHNIVTHPNYLWRGTSFMDIIMAKIRVSLPVVFGVRGSETTHEGRDRLGWKRLDEGWISEAEHYDRMRGLGAGYAALCLRNYSKSPRTNPWPPYHYWNSMALLVDTPPGERSATQILVLTAMIDGFEKKFFEFYGDMAIAALRAALITFPSESPEQSAAVKTLGVLGERLKRDLGLTI